MRQMKMEARSDLPLTVLTQVSIARVYNDDVRRRRAAGAVATRT